MQARVGHIEIFVKDAAASRDWYVANLGAKPVSDQGEFQWVAVDGTELLLRPGGGSHAEGYRDTSVALVLYVKDADQFRSHLEGNGVQVTHGDNDGCLTFQDPDGHWIQAVQN